MILLILIACVGFAASDRLNLGGNDWQLTNGTGKPISVTVPGQVHTDLLNAKLINDPYYGYNCMSNFTLQCSLAHFQNR